MNGWLTATEKIVVHRREVVVDQRVAVEEFDCDGRVEGGVGVALGAGGGLGGRYAKNGAEALAALQAGVKTLRLPAQNQKDVNELPAPAKKGLKIYTHKHIDEIIKVLFKAKK